jgi:hypothetical protein
MKLHGLTKLEKLLFATPLLLLLVPVLSYLARYDNLTKEMQNIAEPNSIDCGSDMAWQKGVAVPDTLMGCAVAAAKAGKPFKMRIEAPNGHMAFGYVGSSKGKMTTINYSWRRRFGIKDWELMEVFEGDCEIKSKNGREEVHMGNSKRIN